MPRAFLITNRRYKTVVEYDSREPSPEPALDTDVISSSPSTDILDEKHFQQRTTFSGQLPTNALNAELASTCKNSLYDAFHSGFHWLSSLEQLADISLATAHRWHLSPPSSPETDSTPPPQPPPPPPPPLLRDSSNVIPQYQSSQTTLLLQQHHLSRHLPRTSITFANSINDDDDLSSGSNDVPQDLSRRNGTQHHQQNSASFVLRRSPSPGSSGSAPGTPPGEELTDSDGGSALILQTSDEEDDGLCPDLEEDDGEVTGGSPGGSNACPECGKRYSTSSNLARHRQTHRSMSDKKARKCPHCDKVYVSMPAYSMHVRTHGQGCQCPFCGKAFSRPWLLQGHIRTHTGEKPFSCPMCSKAFADKSNLRAHIQTHSNVKPYVCARCGKAFALKSYLYKHEESSCMRSTTGGTGISRDNPDSCDVVADVGPIDMTTGEIVSV